MEQKTKKKWNIIDILAAIILLLGLAFVGWKLANRESAAAEAKTIHVTYVAKAEGVDPALYENCKAHLPSPLMASGQLLGGQIESVRQEPYYTLDERGNWVEDPYHVNLYFTASTDVADIPVQTTKVGEQEVRVGKTDYVLKSEYIEFSNVTIVDVIWGEAT
jgi:hypothetical protein